MVISSGVMRSSRFKHPRRSVCRLQPLSGYFLNKVDRREAVEYCRTMRLESYLAEIGQTPYAFAKEWDFAQSAVWRICHNGDARGRIWAKLAVATKGKVTPGDHHPFVPPVKRGRPPGKGKK